MEMQQLEVLGLGLEYRDFPATRKAKAKKE